MTLQQLQNVARLTIPGAKPSVLDDTSLILILNNGVDDINLQGKLLKTNKKFDVVASQQTYSLTTVIANFLYPDKSGLWWNNGTQFTQVYARTLEWLDNNIPNWRDLTAGNPQFYSIDGDTIVVSQTPSTSLTSGFWLYYIQKATPMINSTDYPFSGNAIQMTKFSIFDEAIIKYAKWKISPMLDKDNNDLTEAAYKRERDEKIAEFIKRPDVIAESIMRPPQIC